MIAVVIPFYKLQYFEITLKSLVNQTNQNFNVYIGNDASPESCEHLINKYSDKLNITYVRFLVNVGGKSLSKQWERCISLCKGEEWIMVLGDDDYLGENVIHDFYQNLNEVNDNKCNVVRIASIVINEKKNTQTAVYKHPIKETAEEFFERKMKGETRSSLSEYIFSKSAYQKFKFHNYPSAFYSDDMAWIEYADAGIIYTINTAIAFIRVSSNSLTGNYEQKTFKKAEFEFLKDLMEKRIHFFKSCNRKLILKRLEHLYIYNKVRNLNQWILLYYSYLKYTSFIEFLSFNLRLIRAFILITKQQVFKA